MLILIGWWISLILESYIINKASCSFYAHSGWVVIYAMLLRSGRCRGLHLRGGQRSILTVGLPGLASCRGVFRTYMSFVRGCFASSVLILHEYEAELAELIKALELAQSNYWSSLWIEADSVYLVELVRNRSRYVPWRFSAAWTRSLEFLKSIIFHVSHVYREGNQLADWLASHGSCLNSFTCGLAPRPFVLCLLTWILLKSLLIIFPYLPRFWFASPQSCTSLCFNKLSGFWSCTHMIGEACRVPSSLGCGGLSLMHCS